MNQMGPTVQLWIHPWVEPINFSQGGESFDGGLGYGYKHTIATTTLNEKCSSLSVRGQHVLNADCNLP